MATGKHMTPGSPSQPFISRSSSKLDPAMVMAPVCCPSSAISSPLLEASSVRHNEHQHHLMLFLLTPMCQAACGPALSIPHVTLPCSVSASLSLTPLPAALACLYIPVLGVPLPPAMPCLCLFKTRNRLLPTALQCAPSPVPVPASPGPPQPCRQWGPSWSTCPAPRRSWWALLD